MRYRASGRVASRTRQWWPRIAGCATKRRLARSVVAATERNPRPLRVTRRDDDLGCDVRRVVGYVATCAECGEKMPTCSTVKLARLALEMHELHRHGT
jgi:beta-lactamase class A